MAMGDGKGVKEEGRDQLPQGFYITLRGLHFILKSVGSH